MKYNISEIIDFNTVIFQHYSLITFIITVIIEIFYGIIVYLTTTKTMQFFQILTFIYISECIFAEFLMLCWKPFRLFPFNVLYPTGILAPMSAKLSATICSIFIFLHTCFVETLTIMVVERHFRILGNVSGINRSRIWVYISMAISFIFAVTSVFAFEYLQNFDDTKIQQMLKLEIENIEQILVFQPSLYSLEFNFALCVALFACAIYGNFRVFIFTIILKENYKFVKRKNNSNLSEKTRQQFMLMFQAIMTQFCTTVFFAVFIGIWIATFFIYANNAAMKIIFQLSLGIVIAYPIVDVIIVVAVVKGYRNTLKKIINIIVEKGKEKIFGSNIVHFNNNTKNAAARKSSVNVY